MPIHLSQAEWGAVLIGLSLAGYFLGRLPTISAIMVFLGIVFIGLNGWIITHLAMALGLISRLLGPFIASALGVGIGGVAAAVIAVIAFITLHDWMPKHSAKKRTYHLSWILAVIVVAFLIPVATLIHGIGTGVGV